MSQKCLWGLNLKALRLPRHLEWDRVRDINPRLGSWKFECLKNEERTIEPTQNVTRFQLVVILSVAKCGSF